MMFSSVMGIDFQGLGLQVPKFGRIAMLLGLLLRYTVDGKISD